MLPYNRELPAKKSTGADFLPVAWVPALLMGQAQDLKPL